MSRFRPKTSVMADFDGRLRLYRAERIGRLQARLADQWRHMGWEQRLAAEKQRLDHNTDGQGLSRPTPAAPR